MLVEDDNGSIPSRPDLDHRYQEMSDARTALLEAVHAAHGPRIDRLFSSLEFAGERTAETSMGTHLHERALMVPQKVDDLA